MCIGYWCLISCIVPGVVSPNASIVPSLHSSAPSPPQGMPGPPGDKGSQGNAGPEVQSLSQDIQWQCIVQFTRKYPQYWSHLLRGRESIPSTWHYKCSHCIGRPKVLFCLQSPLTFFLCPFIVCLPTTQGIRGVEGNMGPPGITGPRVRLRLYCVCN